ncbi:hypothetical protein DQ384_02420 [Sphaerisporangium album]|uniref:RHS repeat protein n=1 Tax=Sphaerisporangium album TaxID=509200 RepID=A0A367FUB3_9ACTN|nr:hypothetical protein [Sphaerisporangium album]RCG33297.1 hypothetical protein DQ384_02420 [Sphaerisporangium album]
MTDPRGGGSSPAYRTTFEYDAFGQLTARWAPPDTGGHRAWTQYYYTVGDEPAYGGGVVPHGLVRRVIAPGRTDPEHGPVHDFTLPDIGARWTQAGRFVGFLD